MLLACLPCLPCLLRYDRLTRVHLYHGISVRPFHLTVLCLWFVHPLNHASPTPKNGTSTHRNSIREERSERGERISAQSNHSSERRLMSSRGHARTLSEPPEAVVTSTRAPIAATASDTSMAADNKGDHTPVEAGRSGHSRRFSAPPSLPSLASLREALSSSAAPTGASPSRNTAAEPPKLFTGLFRKKGDTKKGDTKSTAARGIAFPKFMDEDQMEMDSPGAYLDSPQRIRPLA